MPDPFVDGASYSEWDGPSVGTDDSARVATYWGPESGVVLAVDGYGTERGGFDITPESARRLIADLTTVLERLDS
ncbi:hypothetical protein M3D92_03405 [Micrococcus terreus]|uniref:hypothetical protein n=1 Tax=Micrococcus terreus TaxID=574650 RepID=UPI0021A6E1EC|nr:hypothetical protein [Micrococcus terreus]MCT2088348.1 hypothetical protein [Micrococcus terreus]